MDDATIIDFIVRDAVTDTLRKGARELLQAAVAAERDAFLAEFAARRTADAHAAVVGNGYHPECAVQTGIGVGHGESPEGSGQGWQAGDVALCNYAVLRTQSQVH